MQINFKVILFIALTIFVPVGGAFGTNAPTKQLVYVQVQDSKLRTTPQFWAASNANVRYGDELTVVSVQDAWLKVRTSGGKEGFIHVTAVTPRKVVLAAKRSGISTLAEREDIVMAGKGFGPDAERGLIAAGEGGDFAAVNAMERVRISDQEVLQFIREGKLNQPK